MGNVCSGVCSMFQLENTSESTDQKLLGNPDVYEDEGHSKSPQRQPYRFEDTEKNWRWTVSYIEQSDEVRFVLQPDNRMPYLSTLLKVQTMLGQIFNDMNMNTISLNTEDHSMDGGKEFVYLASFDNRANQFLNNWDTAIEKISERMIAYKFADTLSSQE